MEFTNNNDVLIVLNLKDRRGRSIRVSAVRDLKIKVWTHSPDCSLAFDYRDVIQKRDRDELIIKGSYMEALPSGVITYSYSYRTDDKLSHSPHDHHHDHPNFESHSEVVVTDIFWRNMHRELIIESPTYYHTLGLIRELIDREREERFRQIRDLQRYVAEEYTNKLNDEVERATIKEGEIESYIRQVEDNAEADHKEINSKIDDEVKRSNQVDVELLNKIKGVESDAKQSKEELENNLSSENVRANEAESKLQESINTETNRAKAEEQRIEEKLDFEIARSKSEDTQTNLSISAEATRAKGEEARIESRVENEKARAKESEKHLQSDIDDEVKRSKSAEGQLEDKINGVKGDLDKLEDRVQDNKNSLQTALSNEISRATLAETEIKSKVELNDSSTKAELSRIEGKVDNEISRSKEAEKHLQSDIDDEVKRAKAKEIEIENLIRNHFPASENDIKTLTDKLNAEIARSEAEDTKISTAITVLNGEATVLGSVAHSIKDANHYTDIEIENLRLALNKLLDDTITDYVTKDQLQNKIEELIGGAPAAFDTLMELYEALQKDDDAIKALNTVLSEKANSKDVYTKTEIDSKEGDLNNAIKTEEQRSTLAETGLQTQIDSIASEATTLAEKLNSHINESATKHSDLDNAIQSEIQRSTLAENGIQSQLDVINGDEETVGSIQHAVKDLKHTLEDKLEEVKSSFVVDTLSDYALKSEVYSTVEIDRKEGDLSNAILSEEQRATLAESGLQVQIDSMSGTVNNLSEKIESHITASDNKLNDLTNNLTQEINRATNAEEALSNSLTNTQGDLASLTEKVNTHISEADGKYQEFSNAIVSEETRAANEETKLQNAIDVINGDKDQIGSIKHSELDANHYTDDKISEVNLKLAALEATIIELQAAVVSKDEEIADMKKRLEEVEEALSWVVIDE